MEALDLFLLRYDDVHVGFVDELFKGLSDEQVRRRPEGMNSIAWLGAGICTGPGRGREPVRRRPATGARRGAYGTGRCASTGSTSDPG